MLSIKEKRKIRRLVFSKVTLVVLFILFVFIGRATWEVYKKAATAKENRNIAENTLNELNARTENLEEKMARLETQRGQEAELRRKFDIGKEGEHLIVLVDTPSTESADTTAQNTWWQRLKKFFGLVD